MKVSHSLGNDAFLSKIDKLRETNVGSLISLPQVIVVGDQSSGKSSTLESLTDLLYPGAVQEIVVSIIPRPDANDKLKARLQNFRRTLGEMNDDDLAEIFYAANTAMGIRMKDDDDNYGACAFSEDILKIDISGPDETHLTLVDVPGIFRIPTPGLTNDSDIQLVLNMVKRYMENPRTIILAVVPCNVEIVSQEILRLAAEADPDGVRTIGVLTKPDLINERAVRDIVLQLVNGQRNPLKLGYCVLKNRGADDDTSSPAERLASERTFFQATPWTTCNAAALGADALRTHLHALLLDVSKREFPHVRSQIESRHRACTQQLAALGPSRATEAAQRQHLVRIAAHAQDVTKSAINGHYSGDEGLFQRLPALRLITKLVQHNDMFSGNFWKNGHIQHFRKTKSEDNKEDEEVNDNQGDEDDGEGEIPLATSTVNDDLDSNDDVADATDSGSKNLGPEKALSMLSIGTKTYDEIQDIIVPTMLYQPKNLSDVPANHDPALGAKHRRSTAWHRR